jgi:hypothetical protein
MANTRVFGPAQLTASAATKYTVPTGMALDITWVHVENPAGSTATKWTLSVGADAAGTRIWDGQSLAAGSSADYYPNPLTLAAAEIIQAFADVASAIVMVIDGNLRAV